MAALAAGGSGAAAGVEHSYTAMRGKETELADFNGKIRPAIETYYSIHADLLEDSATQDEVIRCATVAINIIQKYGVMVSTVYKRKGLLHYTNGESIPRSMILSKDEDHSKEEAYWRVDVFGQKVIGRGAHKKVKSIVSIEYSLVRHEVTISNDVVCIRDNECSYTALSSSKQKRLRERATQEIENHKKLEASSVFMKLKSRSSQTSKGCTTHKVYTTHPKATLDDLSKFVLSTRPLPGSADRMKTVCRAFSFGARALAELHERESVYCDFKPENLFGFAEDGSWHLGDLESIIPIDKYKKERREIISSPLFVPPECVDYLISYSSKVAPDDPKMHDIWAFGISFLTIIFILDSQREDSMFELLSILANGPKKVETMEDLVKVLSSLTQDGVDLAIATAISKDPRLAPLEPLLKSMLKINPRERMPMARACEEWSKLADSMLDTRV